MPRLVLLTLLLALPGAAMEGTLLWTNGDRSQGEWLGLRDGWLDWRTPLLKETTRLWMPRLHGWEAAASSTRSAPLTGEGWLRLQDGSYFSGSKLAKDGQAWTLENAHAGDLRVTDAAVVEWLRLQPTGALRYAGPGGKAPWIDANPGESPGQRWSMAPGGVLRTRSIGQGIGLPLHLPARSRLDLWLRTEQKDRPPRFSLRLRRQGQSAELVTWMEELVGRSEDSGVALDTLYDSRCVVVLCMDFPARQAFAYDLQGKEKGRWTISGTFPSHEVRLLGGPGSGLVGWLANALAQGKASPQEVKSAHRSDEVTDLNNGLTLVNTGAQLVLERLLVREWDGRPPPSRPAQGPFIELLDGSVRPGTINAIRGSEVRPQKGPPIPLSEVAWISWQPLATTFQQEAFSPGIQAAQLRYADSTTFHGRLLSGDGQQVVFKPDWSVPPVRARRQGLASLRWHEPEPLDGPLTSNTSFQDVLTLEPKGPRYRGHWVPASDSQPHWRLDGADRGVLLDPPPDWSLQRPMPDPVTASHDLPTMASLDTGEIVPVKLADWQGDQTPLYSTWSTDPMRRLPLARVRTLELAGPGLQTRGFADAGWIALPGSAIAVVQADKRSVKLPAGSRLAHGSFLQGNQLQFSLNGESYCSLRVRLFTAGLEEKSPHLALLLSRSGSTLYSGVEDPRRPGQLTGSYHRVRIDPEAPCPITLKWTLKQLELHVSGMLVFRQNLSDKITSGNGLILEPFGMWGNQTRPSEISHLLLRHFPGARPRPALDADTRAWSLAVPRRLADDPPKHLLVAANGDVLRGTIAALNPRHLILRSGLEEWQVPRERITSLLLPAPPPPLTSPEATSPKTSPPSGLWIRTREGGRLCLRVRSLGPLWIEGDSHHLGPCRVPVSEVFALSTQPPPALGHLPHDLTFQLAPEPDLQAPTPAAALLHQQAPEFKLDLAGGGVFELKEARGQVVVLDFWASWCGPCLVALPELVEAMQDLPSDRVRLVGVNLGQSRAEVERFLAARDWGLVSALDLDRQVGTQYGATAIPHTVVVDAQGRIAHLHTGHTATSTASLIKVVRELLDATPP